MENQKKILMIICDGLGDRPTAKLNGKTPLEAAKKPNFNYFAKNSVCGIMDSIQTGVAPGSDTAHMALLGYDPYELYVGRGPIEAAGSGLDLSVGDIAFRCNFSTVDDNLNIIDRRAGRIKTGTHELAKVLNGVVIDDVEFVFKETQEHRGVLIMRGADLSPAITDIDPHANAAVKQAKPMKPDAMKTAEVLNKYVKITHDLLKTHPVNIERSKQGLKPANIILPRGAGVTLKLQSLENRYHMKSACICGVAIVKGVFKLCNGDILDIPGATGGSDSDYNAKIKGAIKAFDKYDFILINMKGPDVYGHDSNAEGKVKCIEKIDAALGILKQEMPPNLIVAITADHSTPVDVMDHSADPVPLCVFGDGVRTDDVTEYDERSLAKGGLCRIVGKNLLPMLQDLANRHEKFGA